MLIPIDAIKEIENIKDHNTRIYEAAKEYAKAGLDVIPLRRGGKILPERHTGMNYFASSHNLQTMAKWFGPGGKFEGWNIGLVCGKEDGIFVIDLDRHKSSEDGVVAWERLTGTYGEPRVPVQLTPSNGKHLIFKWGGNVSSSSNKIAKGIDTRGGDGKPRSHIVVFPSVTEAGEYKWEHGGEIPELPGWVHKKMGEAWSRNKESGRGNEQVVDEDRERIWSIPEIQTLLSYIEIGKTSYESWLHVGQAIHSQHPDPDGLDIWDAWSSEDERYKSGECEQKWKGFNSNGPIRMGSLIHYAQQGGFDQETSPISPRGETEELIDKINKDNGLILMGGKIRIAHRSKDGAIHIMGREDFYTLMYNRRVPLVGSRKRVTEADLWMASELRRECPSGLGFFPGEPLWHKGYVNIWKGWGRDPESGHWGLLEDHILNVVCRGNEYHYEFVLDWCADLLQDPMNPKGTAIVLAGKEGTGKGTFAHIMGKLVGAEHYKHITNDRHLTGNFNAHLLDALLIFSDEAVYAGARSTVGLLKAIVTEKELIAEKKGVDAFSYRNCARLIVASNEDWIIPAGPESRRWAVFEVDDSKANDRTYFDALYRELNTGGYEAFMYDLMNREIKSNLGIAPYTEALQAQRDIYRATGDSVDMWLDHALAIETLGVNDEQDESSRVQGGWPEVVDRIELYNSYTQWVQGKTKYQHKGAAHFYRKVERYGFSKFRPRVKPGQPRRWKYKVPPHEAFVKES